MAIVLTSVLALQLLTTAAAHQMAVAEQPTSIRGSTVPLSVSTSPASLTFHQEDGRLLATVERRLLETDFVVRAQVTAVARASAKPAIQETLPDRGPTVGAHLASGALRLRQAGDSVVLLEYAGTVRGQFQYRRRAATPILRVTPTNALVIDASPLWTAVEPRAAGQAAGQTALLLADASWTSRTVSHPSETPTVLQPLDRYPVSYQLSILRLPEQPMVGRLFDPRVPYLNRDSYIHRWRLEKKDTTAPVSDVVQPIVFRIADNVPQQWIPYLKRGVELWNPVFESIGFRHALVVRLPADTPATKREAVIDWDKNFGDQGSLGATTTDPRTGEILSSEIHLTSDLITPLATNFLLATDPHRWGPLPDTILGALLVYPVAHEVGHVLGLGHNFKGSGIYPTDSLRRPSFLRRMGTVASVMGYTIVNYVPQPEDGVAPLDRIAGIGPYDRWIINWGYRPIPTAATSEAEQPTLEQWRAAQDTAPYLRGSLPMFADPATVDRIGQDPQDISGVLGNDQAKSAGYKIQHLAHMAAGLDLERDTAKMGGLSPQALLAGAWNAGIGRVVNVLGGVLPQPPYSADLSKVQTLPVDSAQQLQAVRFLLAHAFYGEDPLISKYVLASPPSKAARTLVLFDTLAAGWDVEQWQTFQQEVLNQLADWRRLTRIAAQSSSSRTGVLPALCQELAALDQLLSAAAKDSSVPARQQQAQTLHGAVAHAFDPNRGVCTQAH